MRIECIQTSPGEQTQFQDFLDLVSKEDVIVILGISRTARNTKGLLDLFNAMAELEKTGTVKHLAKDVPKGHVGRPKKAIDKFESIYLQVKTGMKSASQGARELNIARSTWYRKVRDYEDDQVLDF